MPSMPPPSPTQPSRVFCFSTLDRFSLPMPTLAPPPPRSNIAAPPRLELPSVSFFGRTLAEYERFFGLDVAVFRNRDVLDVAAGPSSFTAEAWARRVHAVAI